MKVRGIIFYIYSLLSISQLPGESFEYAFFEEKQLSLDSVSLPVLLYPNSKSLKKILFLPDRKEKLQKAFARELSQDFNVVILSNRTGKENPIKFLGGNYFKYLDYYKKEFPVHRRRTSKLKSSHTWDFMGMSRFISQNKDMTVFLTNFSLSKLSDQNIYQPTFSRAVIMSPSRELLKKDLSIFFEGSRLLWLGSHFETEKLKKFADKYGGKFLVYKRSAGGFSIFFRNFQARDDVKKWLGAVK